MINTRQKLIDTARDLFYRHGFQGTGVDVIAESANTTRQTLYNHFESKDDLVVEVLKYRDAKWREELRAQTRLRGGDDPIAQLRSIFDVLREWFANEGFAGCLFINAATEFPSINSPIHQAAKANFDAVRDFIAEIATECGFEDPRRFANKFNIIIEGAIIAELVDRNRDAAELAAELADVLIARSSES